MSAAKRTDGEWRASYTRIGHVIAENGAVIAKCEKLGSFAQMEANAKSIVKCVNAHDELFSIASGLALILDGLTNGNSSAEFEAVRLAERARAAIAKATGVAA